MSDINNTLLLTDHAKARIFDAEEHARVVTANYNGLINKLIEAYKLDAGSIKNIDELLIAILPKEANEVYEENGDE